MSNPQQVQRLNRHHRPVQLLLSKLSYSQAVNALFSLCKMVLFWSSQVQDLRRQHMCEYGPSMRDSILDKRRYIIPVEAEVLLRLREDTMPAPRTQLFGPHSFTTSTRGHDAGTTYKPYTPYGNTIRHDAVATYTHIYTMRTQSFVPPMFYYEYLRTRRRCHTTHPRTHHTSVLLPHFAHLSTHLQTHPLSSYIHVPFFISTTLLSQLFPLISISMQTCNEDLLV